jgi:hypothetical protein
MTQSQYPTNDPTYPALVEAIQKGKCTAFIGSGVSADDYPMWPALMKTINANCGIVPDDSVENFLDQAETALQKNPIAFHETLTNTLRFPDHPRSAERYHALCRINFAGYVTFNFDHLLIHHLNIHRNVSYTAYPRIHRENTNPRNDEVFHAHGYMPPDKRSDECRLVFTRSEFTEAYNNSYHSNLVSFMMDILYHNDACFIGFNPGEEHFLKILKICAGINRETYGLDDHSRRWWYLLSPSEMLSGVELSNANVKHIAYEPIDGRHSGLDKILKHLANSVPPIPKASGASPTFASTERPELP